MVPPLRHISPRTRLVFVGLALVVIPGLFLGYLGLRSVNEKADTIRTSAQATLGLLRDKIENNGSRIEENVRTSIMQGLPAAGSLDDARLWLISFELTNPALSSPVLVASDESIISQFLRYTPERRQVDVMSEPFRGKMIAAEKAEYSDQNLQQARTLYAEAVTEGRSASERALAISRGGRCWYKLGEYAKGIGLYKQLLGWQYRPVSIAGIPAPAVALSEIADGFAAMRDSASHRLTISELRKLLLEEPWNLQDGSYMFYLTLASKGTPTDSLATKEAAILRQAKNIGAVSEYHRRTKLAVGNLISPSILHLSVAEAGWAPTICYFTIPSSSGQKWIGFAFTPDREYLVKRFFPDILSSIDLGGGFIAGVVGGTGTVVAAQDTLKKITPLALLQLTGMFEGWSVALLDKNGRSIDDLVEAEKRFYLALLVGTFVVMLGGFIITIRSGLHEMETARMKTEFVSNVSHELKTPLSLIRMFSETLDSDLPVSQSDRREFVGIIRRESERLTHLINNILDFSRLDSGKHQYHFKSVDAVEMVRRALDVFRYQLQESDFTVETRFPDHPLIVQVDPEAISQAIRNLIDNAIKYSAERKAIRAEVRKDENAAIIVIADEGVGISPDDLQHVFERFYRGKSDKSRQVRGTGLGLSLAKELIEAHGGNITVNSCPEEGSTFTLSIPLAEGMS